MSIGVWEPLWLDCPSRCLYAALHRPDPDNASRCGVVFVPPLFHEQPRSRRFLTEVASGLAALGLPCLRFDFHGTGDSSGRGEQLDFDSMRSDLDLAVATLSARAGVERTTLLAWRGASLPVWSWLNDSVAVDRTVLWDPIVDGGHWLSALERDDARERSQRPRPRPGLRLTDTRGDGQLMGFTVSPQLRKELAHARCTGECWTRVPVWAVLRAGVTPPVRAERVLALPDSAPDFGGGASMEAAFFLSAPVDRFVDELGRGLLGQGP